MADITQIRVTVHTADAEYAGTADWVYLGLAGREFALNSGADEDLATGAKVCFVLGEDNTDEADIKIKPVLDPERNDPRLPQLDTSDLDRYPAYIRCTQSGSRPEWCLELVHVEARTASGEHHTFGNPRLDGLGEKRRIWMDVPFGERLYLTRVDGQAHLGQPTAPTTQTQTGQGTQTHPGTSTGTQSQPQTGGGTHSATTGNGQQTQTPPARTQGKLKVEQLGSAEAKPGGKDQVINIQLTGDPFGQPVTPGSVEHTFTAPAGFTWTGDVAYAYYNSDMQALGSQDWVKGQVSANGRTLTFTRDPHMFTDASDSGALTYTLIARPQPDAPVGRHTDGKAQIGTAKPAKITATVLDPAEDD
ncbi:hypothetical protein ACFYPB_40335 [Streptomyces olivaceoviridis]|uniref:hypothetical protein n=1 Tax=Streptomyces olivaceoviridis TaxID=1921 RepID=UPI00367AAB6F